MKEFLLFATYFFLTTISFAQAEWTGEGDGYSWEDELNWFDSNIPQEGDDILLDGASIDFQGYGFSYGNLELINGSNLLIQDDMYLYGDLLVDVSSVLSVEVVNLNKFAEVIADGNYYLNGDMDLLFSGYAPQIGNSFKIIQSALGSCSMPPTDVVSENQAGGLEIILGVQCQADGVLFTVTDINYSLVVSWDGEGADNQWTTEANWDPNGLPSITDRIVINAPSGAIVNTLGAGGTEAYSVLVGDNNTLVVNGDLALFSIIQLSDSAELIWNAGKISKTDPNVTSALINYGIVNINGASLKEIDSNFKIWNRSIINHNGGNLNINNGEITNYDFGEYNINGDGITIGYSSGSNHSFRNLFSAVMTKTSGQGTSSINLTDFLNYANVISESGTLVIGENVNESYGNYGGSGAIQFPDGFVLDGNISPGSSPGVLTIAGNLTTASATTYNIEIDGPNAGTEYDQIVVTNEAILNGTIHVTLGYLPANDAIFEIVTAANLISCDFPAQITSNFEGTDYTFNVVCQNNILYLNGINAILSVPSFEADSVDVYPNPIKNEFRIKLQTQSKGTWLIYNKLGQKVMQGQLKGLETKIDTEALVSGFYALQIKDENNTTVTVKKIIKS